MSAGRHIKVFRVIDDESDAKVKAAGEAEVKAEVECRRFQFDGTSFSEFEKLVGKIFRLSSAGTETKFSLVYCKTFDAFSNRIDPFKVSSIDKAANVSSVIVISSDKDFAAAWSASILAKEEDPTTWEVVDDDEDENGSKMNNNAIGTINVLRLHLKTQLQ